MCLAIVKPSGREIPFAHFRRGFIRNPHGAGYCFNKDGKVIIKKGFFSLASFWDSYKEDVTPDMTALIHFRWANVSVQNAENCHPWKISDELAMVHNGTLNGYTDFRNGLSDTGNFTNMVLVPLFAAHNHLWNNGAFTSIISRSIGYSKIAVISGDGQYAIYNEGLGMWHEGVWYSNADGVKKLPKKRVKEAKATLPAASAE